MPARILAAAVMLVVAAPAAQATITLQDRQQAACFSDAQRLCGEFIPDAAKTEACMVSMKDRVSDGCRKFYQE